MFWRSDDPSGRLTRCVGLVGGTSELLSIGTRSESDQCHHAVVLSVIFWLNGGSSDTSHSSFDNDTFARYLENDNVADMDGEAYW